MSKTKWTSTNIQDQSGRIAVVTGSSSGIGFEAARVLANKNAKVIVAVRNQQKGDNAVNQIKTENPNADVSVMILDLADLSSVKSFVDEYKSKHDGHQHHHFCLGGVSRRWRHLLLKQHGGAHDNG